MFAVVEINDKQHLVQEGEIFTIDGIIDKKKTTFDSVLMIQNDKDINYGRPYVKGASVEAEVVEAGKREKDVIFKFKRKTGYKLTRGHRQNTTLLKITKINAEKKATAEKKEVAKKTTKKAEKETKE
jgi:large subunit ribosomal protein L21